jgi:endonuclease YncB( thermonuclease family)
MSTFLNFVFSKAGLYTAIALVIFVAGGVLVWKWDHRGAGKTFSSTQEVASAANGATLNVKSGLWGRSSRPLFLAGISAPGLNDAQGAESQKNLASLAGDTVRLESTERPLAAKSLVGQVFGWTGKDLAIAQLQAGLATCETGATKAQQAAQQQAQAAKRGLWANSGGSHWWNFSVAAEGDFSHVESPLSPSEDTPMDYGLLIEIVVAAVIALWIFWSLFGPTIVAKFAPAAAVTTAVDVTQELAAYTALTGVRYMSNVAADPQAVTACEYLLKAVMTWPAATAKTATPAKTA